ncbi:MAG: hypothetical protein HY042_04725 [Spirochaetia bacterium]|nr:hypothetical protein [Spirochaetia bacterium]
MKRWVIAAVFACLFVVGSCSQLNKILGKDDKNNNLLLLLGLALLNQNTCQNQSGMVICIPPGFRQ